MRVRPHYSLFVSVIHPFLHLFSVAASSCLRSGGLGEGLLEPIPAVNGQDAGCSRGHQPMSITEILFKACENIFQFFLTDGFIRLWQPWTSFRTGKCQFKAMLSE